MTASNLPAFVDLTGVATLSVKGLDGDDTISGGERPCAPFAWLHGAHEDVINGGDGADVTLGGAQNDLVDGNGGSDVGILGTGRDSFVWDPATAATPSRAREAPTRSCSTARAATRTSTSRPTDSASASSATLGNITMDTDEVERVDLNTLGGADNAVVNDLTGTDVTLASIDLEGILGGGSGDGGLRTPSPSTARTPPTASASGATGTSSTSRAWPRECGSTLGGGQRPAHGQRPRRRRQVLPRRRPGCLDPDDRQRGAGNLREQGPPPGGPCRP